MTIRTIEELASRLPTKRTVPLEVLKRFVKSLTNMTILEQQKVVVKVISYLPVTLSSDNSSILYTYTCRFLSLKLHLCMS